MTGSGDTPSSAFASLNGAAEWYRLWLRDEALPLWWRAGADHATGGFHEGLSIDGRPLAVSRRGRVQSRQMFSYATAADLGCGGPGLEAVLHGWSYLRQRYGREDGLFRHKVNPAGEPEDDRTFIYDQAFALLGMSALHAHAPHASDGVSAHLALADALDARRHPAGGYREAGDHPFQANAHMHMFEACLAWMKLGETRLEPVAEGIVELVRSRFFDPDLGCIREFFGPDWRAAPGDDGRVVEPGHQFEWAWLLAQWSSLRDDAWAASLAETLFANGCRGIDARGVVLDELWDDMSVRRGTARLWPQTEYLRAALALGHQGHALQAATTLRRYLQAPLAGGWFDRLEPDDSFVTEACPASSLYHLVGAIRELADAAGRPHEPDRFRFDPVDLTSGAKV